MQATYRKEETTRRRAFGLDPIATVKFIVEVDGEYHSAFDTEAEAKEMADAINAREE